MVSIVNVSTTAEYQYRGRSPHFYSLIIRGVQLYASLLHKLYWTLQVGLFDRYIPASCMVLVLGHLKVVWSSLRSDELASCSCEACDFTLLIN